MAHIVNSQVGLILSDAPWMQLSWDANFDGQTTIGDIKTLIVSIFYIPSDSLLFLIFKAENVMVFFEAEKTFDHAIGSTILSIVCWLEVLWHVFVDIPRFVSLFYPRS